MRPCVDCQATKFVQGQGRCRACYMRFFRSDEFRSSRQPWEARLFSGFVFPDGPGCWLWTRTTNDRGYGQLYVTGKHVYTHRLMWRLLRGPVPAGLELDHLCGFQACGNPGHLEAVPHRVNCQRGANAAKRELVLAVVLGYDDLAVGS